MKKKLIFAAAAIAMLASCSQNDLEAPVVGQAQQSDAIEFGTYIGKAATSRGADPTSLTTDNLKSFGVFAFYSEGVSADGVLSNSDTPNFMFNQKVTGGKGNYTYSPVKYWPNQDGVATNGKEDHKDVLSFFAYAPYMGLNDGTNASTETANGIALVDDATNSYTNTTTYGTSKPKIYYKRNTTNYNGDIDLLWAAPQKNMAKQPIDGKVTFAFKHAMSKIAGKVNVRYLKDLVNAGGTTGDAVDATTTVKLKSVYIWAESDDASIVKSGWLSLEDGTWTGDAFYSEIDEYDDAVTAGFYESKTGGSFAGLTGDVVTNANQQLTDFTGFLMLPGNAKIVKIKARAIYNVETTDANLAGGKSTVENDITNEISIAASALTANKNYVINLVLGLTSIKIDATVDEWVDSTPATEGEVDLPKNEVTPAP